MLGSPVISIAQPWVLRVGVCVLALGATSARAVRPAWEVQEEHAVEAATLLHNGPQLTLAAARQREVPALVFLTGSDWNPRCQRLVDEVLQSASFQLAATDSYVLGWVDFPQGAERRHLVPDPAENARFRQRYRVASYPWLLLLTGEGDVLVDMAYGDQGPELLLAQLAMHEREGREDLARMLAWSAELERAADEPARRAVVGEVVGFLERRGADSVRFAPAFAVARAALWMPWSDRGVLSRQSLFALLGCGQVDGDVLTRAVELDPRNEFGLFEASLYAARDHGDVGDFAIELRSRLLEFRGRGLVPTNRASMAQLAFLIGDWSANPSIIPDTTAAQTLLGWSLELAPEAEHAARAREILATLDENELVPR